MEVPMVPDAAPELTGMDRFMPQLTPEAWVEFARTGKGPLIGEAVEEVELRAMRRSAFGKVPVNAPASPSPGHLRRCSETVWLS
jgi:hypothetical protein